VLNNERNYTSDNKSKTKRILKSLKIYNTHIMCCKQRCQLLLELKLDKISQRGDQRIYLMVFFDNRVHIICFFLLFSLFLNNIKISTLDAMKVIKNYLESVQFSGYFFGNLWNSLIIITNFFSCYFIISTKVFII
jgi:hypothetical protein